MRFELILLIISIHLISSNNPPLRLNSTNVDKLKNLYNLAKRKSRKTSSCSYTQSQCESYGYSYSYSSGCLCNADEMMSDAIKDIIIGVVTIVVCLVAGITTLIIIKKRNNRQQLAAQRQAEQQAQAQDTVENGAPVLVVQSSSVPGPVPSMNFVGYTRPGNIAVVNPQIGEQAPPADSQGYLNCNSQKNVNENNCSDPHAIGNEALNSVDKL